MATVLPGQRITLKTESWEDAAALRYINQLVFGTNRTGKTVFCATLAKLGKMLYIAVGQEIKGVISIPKELRDNIDLYYVDTWAKWETLRTWLQRRRPEGYVGIAFDSLHAFRELAAQHFQATGRATDRQTDAQELLSMAGWGRVAVATREASALITDMPCHVIATVQEEVERGVPLASKKNPYGEVEPDDLLRYGLIPELIGRLPVQVSLEALDEESLMRILVEPKNALTKQYRKLFELEEVRLTFEQDALRAVAEKALSRGAGARGLRAILEKVMTDIMFELPGRDDVTEVAITKECITEARPPLLVTERPRAKKEA